MPKTKLKPKIQEGLLKVPCTVVLLAKMLDVKAVHNKVKQKAPTNEKLALVSLKLGDKLQLLSAFLP